MSAAAVIQPNTTMDDMSKDHQQQQQATMLTLLDSSCSLSSSSIKNEDDEELQQKKEILSYLQKASPVSSTTTSLKKKINKKRVPRLGPYLLLKTLGVGEFGKVKMGRHVETGQTVAVKLVKKENIDSSSQLEKIRMEIDILKTLNHPHIVKLLSVNETTNCIGMVIEFAQGGELFEYIYRQRYLKENEAKRLFSQLISCVYYMHQKNIVHRDLKLENILLDHHGNLIVTDFGFANQFTQITGDLMSTSCGSPVYAAPELVMTGRLYSGTGVDIWSCGIILYAMLCGYLPFDDDIKNPNGDNIGRLYRYIMANSPKYPSHLSHDSKDVISKMLIPDPNARCKIETIMVHPWLHKYKDQMSKSVQELELEAKELKNSLLRGIESKDNDDNNDVEDVCCDDEVNNDDESRSNSSRSNSNSMCCSSIISTCSNTTKENNMLLLEVEEQDTTTIPSNNNNDATTTHHSSPPTTPIPYSNSLSMTSKISEASSHASQKQSGVPASLEQHDAMPIPVIVPKIEKSDNNDTSNNNKQVVVNNEEEINYTNSQKIQQATSSSSSSSSSLLTTPITVNKKRHTIDAIVLTQPQQADNTSNSNRPVMPTQHSSLRAKLFSSVKRRNPATLNKKFNSANNTNTTNNNNINTTSTNMNEDNNTNSNNNKKPGHSKRHSWQNIIHRHHSNYSEQQLPLSPPLSPTPEQSKSVRLLSWLKNKSPSTSTSPHQNQRKRGGRTTSTSNNTTNNIPNNTTRDNNNSNEIITPNTIPIAKPSSSSLGGLHSATNTTNSSAVPSRAPTVLSLSQQQQQQQNDTIDEEEEISIESELRVHTGDMNRSALTSKQPMEVLLEINKILIILGIEVINQGGYKLHCIRRSTDHFQQQELTIGDDRMNHLSTSYQPSTSLPIYGHPTIDDGKEIQFTVEICRFENLSGLFSVDIQACNSNDENYSGYQFIGQKLLALLHLGNAIRNTNFNVMLSRNDS